MRRGRSLPLLGGTFLLTLYALPALAGRAVVSPRAAPVGVAPVPILPGRVTLPGERFFQPSLRTTFLSPSLAGGALSLTVSPGIAAAAPSALSILPSAEFAAAVSVKPLRVGGGTPQAGSALRDGVLPRFKKAVISRQGRLSAKRLGGLFDNAFDAPSGGAPEVDGRTGRIWRGLRRYGARMLERRFGAPPVLEFPTSPPGAREKVLRVRFYRDSNRNPFQIQLDGKSGRVIHTWSNGLNESFGFTVRNLRGKAVAARWAGRRARARKGARGDEREMSYELALGEAEVEIGGILLDSVIAERQALADGIYEKPFSRGEFLSRRGAADFREMSGLIGRLPEGLRREQLKLWNAESLEELEARFGESISEPRIENGRWTASIARITPDGRYTQTLELSLTARDAMMELDRSVLSVRSLSGRALKLRVSVRTDAPPILNPLRREQIFKTSFLGAASESEKRERDLRAAELLFTDDKLLAGLSNYGTYFGRDTLMTALMMEGVWKGRMLLWALKSVLRRLGPTGRVSHEEVLGYEAYRRNMREYNAKLGEVLALRESGDETAARRVLGDVRVIAARISEHRERYEMVDDDFQLSVLTARYLGRTDVPEEEKKEFLLGGASPGAALRAILRNLRFIIEQARPYGEDPRTANLIGFPREGGGWFSGSWRDSRWGYAGGRIPMDVNVVWVPQALRAARTILRLMRQWAGELPELGAAVFDEEALARDIRSWEATKKHFEVRLDAAEARERLAARLKVLPGPQRRYWESILERGESREIKFLAVALDEEGRPIPVLNSDLGAVLWSGEHSPEDVRKLIRPLLEDFPRGLFVEGVGVLAANDAYAGPAVWKGYQDKYHSPEVVWGREMNLIALGLARHILAAFDEEGRLKDPGLADYVLSLRDALEKVRAAAEASNLSHNELWTYRIKDGAARPVAYGSAEWTSTIRLWSLASLVVEDALERVRAAAKP